jgi:CheY-like chemotaxis protein
VLVLRNDRKGTSARAATAVGFADRPSAPRRVRPPRLDERRRRQVAESGLRAGAGTPRHAPRRRVLVVDDEPAMRALCRVNLLASGMDVVEAADGIEALDAVRSGDRPDLVLLDVMMPGLSGWEVAAELAGDPRTQDIPVVFLTARADAEDRERGSDLGAVGYLTKPFDPLGLADVVDRTLERVARGERDQLREEVRRSR